MKRFILLSVIFIFLSSNYSCGMEVSDEQKENPYKKLAKNQHKTGIMATKVEEKYEDFTVAKGFKLKGKAGFELHTLHSLYDEGNDFVYGVTFGHKDKIFQLTNFNNPYEKYLKKQLKEKKHISKGTLQIVRFFNKKDVSIGTFFIDSKEELPQKYNANFFQKHLSEENGFFCYQPHKMYATVECVPPKRSTLAWLFMKFLVFCRMREREKPFKIRSCTGREFKRCSDKFSGWFRECSGEEAVAGIIAKYGHIYDFSNLKEEEQ